MERLSYYPDDVQLAFVWFDKDEIDEEMTDSDWSARCDDLVTSDEMLDAARRVLQ
jgi:hypothetical protein